MMKSTTPIAELAEDLPWAADMPGLVRFIGISELAAFVAWGRFRKAPIAPR